MFSAKRKRTRSNKGGAKETVKPTDLYALQNQVRRKKIELSKSKRSNRNFLFLTSGYVSLGLAKLARIKPYRVWNYYASKLGQIIAAGLSFLLFFAIISLVFIGFTVAGFVLNNKPDLLDALVELVNNNAPRLLKTQAEEGLIDPAKFLSPDVLFSLGLIAFGVLLFSALGWIGATRNAIRTVCGVPEENGKFFLYKLRDVMALIFLGIVMVLSIVLTFSLTHTLAAIMHELQIESDIAFEIIRYNGLVVVYLLDVVVSFIIFRVASGIRISRRIMWQMNIFTALGMSLLRLLGTAALGASTRYPELAVYAVPLGLLIWFNFINQIYLLGAAWGAVSMADQEQAVIKKLGARGQHYEKITGKKRSFS